VLCTAFLCLSDRLMLLLYTIILSLCLLLKLKDDDDDDDDDDADAPAIISSRPVYVSFSKRLSVLGGLLTTLQTSKP